MPSRSSSSSSASSSVVSQRPPAAPGVWKDADFRRLWLGQAASQLGEQAGRVVLPLLAVAVLGAGPGQLGVLRAVEQAPVLLLSLVAGAWVDRRRCRTVMVAADLGRAVALAALPVASVLGLLGFPVLLATAFLVGSLGLFFDVAYQASLVRLVPRDRLARDTGVLEGTRSAAQFAGPALGGTMLSLFTAPGAALVSGLFLAVSAGSLRRIRRGEEVPGTENAAADAELGTGRGRADRLPPLRRQIREGLHLVAADPALRAVCAASAAFQCAFAAFMTGYLLFLPRQLHLPGADVGLVLAATGPGAVAGSLLAAALPRRFGYGLVLVSAAALGDGVTLCVPAVHGAAGTTVPLLMAVNFVFALGGQTVDVTVMAIRQALTPVRTQARVVATMNVAGLGLAPLGSLLGGFLVPLCGLRTTLLLTALAMTLSPLTMALSPLSRLGTALPADTA